MDELLIPLDADDVLSDLTFDSPSPLPTQANPSQQVFGAVGAEGPLGPLGAFGAVAARGGDVLPQPPVPVARGVSGYSGLPVTKGGGVAVTARDAGIFGIGFGIGILLSILFRR